MFEQMDVYSAEMLETLKDFSIKSQTPETPWSISPNSMPLSRSSPRRGVQNPHGTSLNLFWSRLQEKDECLAGCAQTPGMCFSHLYHSHLENIPGLRHRSFPTRSEWRVLYGALTMFQILRQFPFTRTVLFNIAFTPGWAVLSRLRYHDNLSRKTVQLPWKAILHR